MVPVFRTDEPTPYPRPAHIPLKTHSTRSTRSPRTTPNSSLSRMTVNQFTEEVSKFCEYHSRHAAYHLAHSVHVFMRDSALPAPITQAHLMDKFLEGFRTHFESGYRLAQTGANDEMKCSDSTCCQSEHKGSRFKQIKDLVFGKTQWTDVNLQPLCSSNIIKVGSVSLLTEKSGELSWQKIWLLLTRTESGNMLYLYTNKSGAPHMGVRCSLLKEARPTRNNEDMTLKNAFVIKTKPGQEYVLLTQCRYHRNDWVRQVRATIHSDDIISSSLPDDLSDSEDEDGRSNTGFSSGSTGTSTSDSLEATYDGPTHLEINEFRMVSEHELLSERRLPKPNSYTSLPHSKNSLRGFGRFGRSSGNGDSLPMASRNASSLPSSRSASRHSNTNSRSNSPDFVTKQRSNSLRHDSRNNVFMPQSSNSLPYPGHLPLSRNTSLGSDSSLPSGASSTHSSLGRVVSAPPSSGEGESLERVNSPERVQTTFCDLTVSEERPHPPPQCTPRQFQNHAALTQHHPHQHHTYSNIPVPSVPPAVPSLNIPSITMPSTPSTLTTEAWTDRTALEPRHCVPPLEHGNLMVQTKNHGDGMSSLLSMPWFHSSISRGEAAQHVIMGGADAHGRFLIRKSGTSQGEFVLTFNRTGRAKHLRMSVTGEGHCSVQHLQFPAVEQMIEYFRSKPIPLDVDDDGPEVILVDHVPSDLQDEGTPVPSASTNFFPTNQIPERPPSISPIDRPRSRTPPERPPRNTETLDRHCYPSAYKGPSSRV